MKNTLCIKFIDGSVEEVKFSCLETLQVNKKKFLNASSTMVEIKGQLYSVCNIIKVYEGIEILV